MRKNEYLQRLGAALGSLPKAEREKYLAYYSEVIDDRIEEGCTEEAAVAELESVYAAAERIIAESGLPRERKKGLGAGAIICISLVALLLAFAVYTLTSLPGRSLSENPLSGQSSEGLEDDSSRTPASGTRFELDFPADTTGFDLALIRNYVEVLPSEDDSYHLVYYVTDVAPLELIEQGSFITLRDKNIDKYNGSTSVGFVGKSPETTVLLYVPEGAKPELSVASVSCDIIVTGVQTDNLSIANVSGDIELRSSECLRLDIASVSGGLFISDSESRDLNYAATSGAVELTNFKTGPISVGNVSGSIHLDNAEFTSLSIGTVSGSLTGTLTGSREDYTVNFESLSGRNSLGSLSGGKIDIDFGSVSGGIDLKFAG